MGALFILVSLNPQCQNSIERLTVRNKLIRMDGALILGWSSDAHIFQMCNSVVWYVRLHHNNFTMQYTYGVTRKPTMCMVVV